MDYRLVSEAVILRDYITPNYLNDEHKKLVDIADSIFNAGIKPEIMIGEYKELYCKYGKDFFKTVLSDCRAIKSQIDDYNKQDLLDDYNDLFANIA